MKIPESAQHVVRHRIDLSVLSGNSHGKLHVIRTSRNGSRIASPTGGPSEYEKGRPV